MKVNKNGFGEFIMIGLFVSLGFSGLNEAKAEDLGMDVQKSTQCYQGSMANYKKIQEALEDYKDYNGAELKAELGELRITEREARMFLYNRGQFAKRECLGLEAFVTQDMPSRIAFNRKFSLQTPLDCQDEKEYQDFAIKENGKAKRYPEEAKAMEVKLRAAFPGLPAKSEEQVAAMQCRGDAVADASQKAAETVGGEVKDPTGTN